jgi:hypothetical protein
MGTKIAAGLGVLPAWRLCPRACASGLADQVRRHGHGLAWKQRALVLWNVDGADVDVALYTPNMAFHRG